MEVSLTLKILPEIFSIALASSKKVCYDPEFDSVLTKKVPEAALGAAFGTFLYFTAARYTFCFLVCEQIFFIFLTGTICLEVQKPNASCRASVSSVRV